MKSKLTDLQVQLLSQAAANDDGMVDMPAEGKSAVLGLIKRGLMMSIPQGDGPSRLLIMAAGYGAIGAEPPGAELDEIGQSTTPDPKEDAGDVELPELPPAKSKLALLVDLLKRPEGATIEQMTKATGWQPHSVRGAISGGIKKGLGHSVVSEKADGVRVYRITAEA